MGNNTCSQNAITRACTWSIVSISLPLGVGPIARAGGAIGAAGDDSGAEPDAGSVFVGDVVVVVLVGDGVGVADGDAVDAVVVVVVVGDAVVVGWPDEPIGLLASNWRICARTASLGWPSRAP